jgi:ribonuclease P protein component
VMREKKLRKTKEYATVYRRGEKIYGKYVLLFFMPNQQEISRFGVVTTKKVGNAVIRNKWRRRIKEIVREYGDDLQSGYDIIVLARPRIKESEFSSVKKDITRVLRKARLLR